jgi:hypothetical protein
MDTQYLSPADASSRFPDRAGGVMSRHARPKHHSAKVVMQRLRNLSLVWSFARPFHFKLFELAMPNVQAKGKPISSRGVPAVGTSLDCDENELNDDNELNDEVSF